MTGRGGAWHFLHEAAAWPYPWGLAIADTGERKAWFEASADKIEDKLKELLTPGQKKRLHEVWLQGRGVAAFSDPVVVEALGLTAAQKDAVRKAQDEYGAAWFRQWQEWEQQRDRDRKREKDGDTGEAVKEPTSRPAPPWEIDRRLREQAVESVVAELSPAQAQEWQQLVGKPFTGNVFMGGPGRGGPGGPPGGPGGPGGGPGGRGGRGRGGPDRR